MTLAQWFDAAKAGKGQFVAEHKEEFQKQTDQQFPRATALIYAVENGQENVAKLLISSERRLYNQFGWCALHCAVYHGFASLARLLANYEADILTSQAWRDVPAGASALQIAMQCRNYEIVQILQQGESFNAFYGRYEMCGQDSIGRTSLHYLALSAALDLSESEFIQVSGELSRQCDFLGKTATMLAAECGNVEFLRRMGDQNPELKMQIDCSNNEAYRGCTALMLAANANRVECAEMLAVHEGRMINFLGYSALMYAAKRGNIEIIHLLRPYEAGIKTTKTFGYVSSGSTALLIAKINAYEAAAYLLLEAEKDMQDDYGRSYLTVSKQPNRLRESVGGFEGSRALSTSYQLTQSQLVASTRLNDSRSSHGDAGFPRASYVVGSPCNSLQGPAVPECHYCAAMRESLTDLRKQCARMSSQLESELLNEDEPGFTARLNVVISKLATMTARIAPYEADPAHAVQALDKLVDDLQNGYKLMFQRDVDEMMQDSKALKQQLRSYALRTKKLEDEQLEQTHRTAVMEKELGQLRYASESLTAQTKELRKANDKLYTEKQETALEIYKMCEVFSLSRSYQTVEYLRTIKLEYDDLKDRKTDFEDRIAKVQEEAQHQINQLTTYKEEADHKCQTLEESIAEIETEIREERENAIKATQESRDLRIKNQQLQTENAKLSDHKGKSLQRIYYYSKQLYEIQELFDVPYTENIMDDLTAHMEKAKQTETQLEALYLEADYLNGLMAERDERIALLSDEHVELQNRITTVQQASYQAREQFSQFMDAMGQQYARVVSAFEGCYK